jgi:hypothetical protein
MWNSYRFQGFKFQVLDAEIFGYWKFDIGYFIYNKKSRASQNCEALFIAVYLGRIKCY